MDKFEIILTSSQTPPVERVREIEQWKGICICSDCPTYNDCSKNSEELFFCFIGRSFHCISDIRGCLCKNCPVTATYALKYNEFCTKGSEMAQRWFDGLVLSKQ
jgi:hypothetical protein